MTTRIIPNNLAPLCVAQWTLYGPAMSRETIELAHQTMVDYTQQHGLIWSGHAIVSQGDGETAVSLYYERPAVEPGVAADCRSSELDDPMITGAVQAAQRWLAMEGEEEQSDGG